MAPRLSRNGDTNASNVWKSTNTREMRAPERTSTKITKNMTIRCSPKTVIKLVAQNLWNWLLWVPKGAKDRRREVQKTYQKRYHKSTNTCHKYAPKGGSQKVIFVCLFGSPSQDGLQGVPGQAPRPKSVLKWMPWDGFSGIWSQLCHTLWRHFGDVSCIPWTTYW